jgi:hypothetical protein
VDTERGKLEVMLHEGKQVGAVLLLGFCSVWCIAGVSGGCRAGQSRCDAGQGET